MIDQQEEENYINTSVIDDGARFSRANALKSLAKDYSDTYQEMHMILEQMDYVFATEEQLAEDDFDLYQLPFAKLVDKHNNLDEYSIVSLSKKVVQLIGIGESSGNSKEEDIAYLDGDAIWGMANHIGNA